MAGLCAWAATPGAPPQHSAQLLPGAALRRCPSGMAGCLPHTSGALPHGACCSDFRQVSGLRGSPGSAHWAAPAGPQGARNGTNNPRSLRGRCRRGSERMSEPPGHANKHAGARLESGKGLRRAGSLERSRPQPQPQPPQPALGAGSGRRALWHRGQGAQTRDKLKRRILGALREAKGQAGCSAGLRARHVARLAAFPAEDRTTRCSSRDAP